MKYVYGEFWSSYARVPSGCEIIYGTPPEEAKTRTGVPYAWLEGYGLGDGTTEGCEAAAEADAANGAYKVWECYVAGLDPIDLAATFTAEIAFSNGSPVVTWTPDMDEERAYQLLGKRKLADEAWDEVPDGADVETEGWRFFRVRVELPQE